MTMTRDTNLTINTRKIHIRIFSAQDAEKERKLVLDLLESFSKQFAKLEEEKNKYLTLKTYCIENEIPSPLKEIPELMYRCLI